MPTTNFTPAGTHESPAPEPHRSVALGDTPEYGREVFAQPDGQIAPGEIRSTPPPVNPESSQRGAREGDLIRALGEQKSLYERQLAEMRLQQEALAAQIAAQRAAPQAAPTLPPGVRPNDPVSMGQFAQVIRGLYDEISTMTQVRTLRSSYGIDDETERAIIAENPVIGSLPEPSRTQFLIKAVSIRQPNGHPARTANGQTANGADSRRQQQTRPQQGVVPHVEHGANGAAAPELVSNTESLRSEWEAAGKLPPKQAIEARRAIYQRALESQGVSQDRLWDVGWTMK